MFATYRCSDEIRRVFDDSEQPVSENSYPVQVPANVVKRRKTRKESEWQEKAKKYKAVHLDSLELPNEYLTR